MYISLFLFLWNDIVYCRRFFSEDIGTLSNSLAEKKLEENLKSIMELSPKAHLIKVSSMGVALKRCINHLKAVPEKEAVVVLLGNLHTAIYHRKEENYEMRRYDLKEDSKKEEKILEICKQIIKFSKTPFKPLKNEDVHRLSLNKKLQLRGLASLSNLLLVRASEEKDFLIGIGIPKRKILFIDTSTNFTKKVLKITVPKQFPVLDGLYALFSSPYLHVNILIKNKYIEKLYARAVVESPHIKESLCIRGPHRTNVYESFLSYKDGKTHIYTVLPDVITYKKGILQMRSSDVRITIDGEKNIQIVFPKYMSVMKCILEPSTKHLWKHATEKNFFTASHPFLRSQIFGVFSHLYNRPRRSVAEPFDMVLKKSSWIRQVNINGALHDSGYGIATRRFSLNLLIDQRFYVTLQSFYLRQLKADSFDTLILYTYLIEAVESHVPAYKLPKRFKYLGAEIRNFFPINLNNQIPDFFTLVHYPWEFLRATSPGTHELIAENTEIFTPSAFSQQIHISNGISKEKIHVIQHGVSYYSLNLEQKIRKKQKQYTVSKIFGASKKYIRFLVLNGALKRKGIEKAISAYISAFTSKDHVVLRIHCAYGDPKIYRVIMRLIAQNKKNKGPKIVYTRGMLSLHSVQDLLSEAHFLISPFRGEGFGLTILEAMAFGTVPIITGCPPATEFCKKDSCFFIPYKIVKCKSDPVQVLDNGQLRLFGCPLKEYPLWASPSTVHLTNILKKAHLMKQNDSEGYKMYRKKCKVIAQSMEWSKVISKLSKLIIKLDKKIRESSPKRTKSIPKINFI
ncbi:hypothetical protein NEFER03_1396 [Nematocida sp. LUAm3]|nr:hypothetical protein NEFER03_1396 [Nematocida sp. LUAm3]KAI5174774.1 hypothetical protein NEFER02_0884 [Nematocida sp. LUAm2]KAI5177815.1 hypothetical protein NEFER01_1017 [Nematocida sp. LUAm1]